MAEASHEASTTITRAGGTACRPPSERNVSEYSSDAALDSNGDLQPVFAHGADRRYRVVHDGDDTPCPCESLGRHGCPVSRYTARDGSVTLVFHAADYDELQTVVGDLRDQFPDMNIERLVRSPEESGRLEHVLVDRGKLTARQLEILETAQEMGYFERPRRANATTIAETLDIDPSTFSEHLAAAQRKLLEDFL